MATLDEIVSFCDLLLEIEAFDDACPNGLQVPGRDDVELVLSGVSANLELIDAAAEAGAGLVIAHHGLFWNAQPRSLTPALAERLRPLLAGRIAHAAYHLPLDAHPEIGNNALICERLGLERSEPFGLAGGRPVGFVGRAADGPISFEELVGRVRELTGREPLAFAEGPAEVGSVGIVSGGGAPMLEEAVALGLDAMLSGEPNEPALAGAKENRVNFIAAGHHATETFGIRRLGELVAERFGIEHRFVEIPNPV